MTRGWSGVVALGVATAFVGRTAQSQMTFVANMTTGQEPPGTVTLTAGSVKNVGDPRPTPFGTAVLVLNAAGTQLTMTATIFNIDVTGSQTPFTNDNLAAAHIHANADLGEPLTRPVVWGFFGAPDNDINPDQLVVTPLVGAVGGTFTSVWDLPEGNGGTNLTAQLPNLIAGRAYINFHTVENPGGEIRGQIALVPEPSTYALLATGLGVVGMVARRRRAAA